jgi:hypothetical protein
MGGRRRLPVVTRTRLGLMWSGAPEVSARPGHPRVAAQDSCCWPARLCASSSSDRRWPGPAARPRRRPTPAAGHHGRRR